MPENLSFETENATDQGKADSWDVDSDSFCLAFIDFNDNGSGTAWSPAESFEDEWQFPYLVHYATDAASTVVGGPATDFASAYTLANEFKAQYNLHIEQPLNVHQAIELAHEITAADATDAATLYTLLNSGRIQYNIHIDDWPDIHRKADVQNVVDPTIVPDATSEGTAVDLVNALQTAFNLHILLLGYGKTNSDALSALADVDISQAAFDPGDVYADSFEYGWAIPDRFEDPDDQRDMVSMDVVTGPSASTYLNLFIAEAAGVSALQLTTPLLVSWPSGHTCFLDNFNEIESESFEESFDNNWIWPGTIAGYTVKQFIDRYYDSTTEAFAYIDVRLEALTAETFESGWEDNDVWFTKYWDPVDEQFEYEAADLEDARFGLFDFATLEIGGTAVYNGIPTGLYSPSVQLEVTEAFTDSPWITMVFEDQDSISRTCYWLITAAKWAVDSIITTVRATMIATDPEFEFATLFSGCKQVTSLVASTGTVGAIKITGQDVLGEDFEDFANWTRSLALV